MINIFQSSNLETSTSIDIIAIPPSPRDPPSVKSPPRTPTTPAGSPILAPANARSPSLKWRDDLNGDSASTYSRPYNPRRSFGGAAGVAVVVTTTTTPTTSAGEGSRGRDIRDIKGKGRVRMSSTSSTASGGSRIGSPDRLGRASRSTSVTYNRQAHSEELDRRLDELEGKVNKEKLLEEASRLNDGKKASFGKRVVGGFNLLLEIMFEDDKSWFARIPKPWRSSNPEQTLHGEVSAYRYLKSHTKIPVPEVFSYKFASDEDNNIGVSYMLVEKMQGKPTPQLGDDDESHIKARRFHEQLANIIMELGSVKFDKIGLLQESRTTPGEFEIGPLYDFYTTYPLTRGKTQFNRGPYGTMSEYFNAIAELNHKATKFNYRPSSSSSHPLDEELARLHLIKKMIPTFADSNEYNAGPFVMQDWDLTSQNILVDDDCNITAVLDVNGVIGPVPNLGRYPDLIYETTMTGPIFDQKLFREIFESAEAPEHLVSTSALADIEVRKSLMKTAHKVWMFEHTLMYPAHKNLNLYGKGGLYEFVFGVEDFSELEAFDKIGKTDVEFQATVPRSRSNSRATFDSTGRGKGNSIAMAMYSWEERKAQGLQVETNSQRSESRSNRSSSRVRRRMSLRESIKNNPIAVKRREEAEIKEYVREHRHLPPGVQAEPLEKRLNGPEKMFTMAWKFLTCR